MTEQSKNGRRSAVAAKILLGASVAVHAISILIQIYYANLFGPTVGVMQLISYAMLFLLEILPAVLVFVGVVLVETGKRHGGVFLALACLLLAVSSLYGMLLSFRNGVTVLNWSYVLCQAVICVTYGFVSVDAFRGFRFLSASRVLGAFPIAVGIIRHSSSGISLLDRLVFSPEMLVGLAISQTWGMLADLSLYVAVFVYLLVNVRGGNEST